MLRIHFLHDALCSTIIYHPRPLVFPRALNTPPCVSRRRRAQEPGMKTSLPCKWGESIFNWGNTFNRKKPQGPTVKGRCVCPHSYRNAVCMLSTVDCTRIVGAIKCTIPPVAYRPMFMTYWSDYVHEVMLKCIRIAWTLGKMIFA